MNPKTFTEYALSSTLTPDATYTVEILIEKARAKFDPNYLDDWSARGDARESPDYKPQFSKEHVNPAEQELRVLSWLSLQRTRAAARPIRDLSALQLLPAVAGLVLINNDISDISPIANCTNLRRLHLQKNPIRDISALANCTKIEELELGETPIGDFAVLETLPNPRKLSISINQIPAFRRLNAEVVLRSRSLDEAIEFGNEYLTESGYRKEYFFTLGWGPHGIRLFRRLESENLTIEKDRDEVRRFARTLKGGTWDIESSPYQKGFSWGWPVETFWNKLGF